MAGAIPCCSFGWSSSPGISPRYTIFKGSVTELKYLIFFTALLLVSIPAKASDDHTVSLHCAGEGDARNQLLAIDGSWMKVIGSKAKRIIRDGAWHYATLQSNGEPFLVVLDPRHLFITVKNGENIMGEYHCFPFKNPFTQ